ncbi:MAG: YlmH/Sll1252 family protein [Clostridiales bacterium]|nr:YlmH/Sll1252 family protein [Clostridiales bacterium]MCD8115563.1 YlmH/Sll1252 family protein [Oscillospiraceae bacterium]
MEKELEKRIEELADRCQRTGRVTQTGFLTPAELFEANAWAARQDWCRSFAFGGHPACERQVMFFLPDYMEPADLSGEDYIHALRVQAYYAAPGHRDYMGAALGLGIRREFMGDIWVEDDSAVIFCLPSVEGLLLEELRTVGRANVKVSPLPLSDLPEPQRKVTAMSFTVKSLRLDAVAGHMFGLSRTAAAEAIRQGAVSLNYTPCLHVDAPISEGDILSLRGHGKGALTRIGERSKKDRIFLEAEIYL